MSFSITENDIQISKSNLSHSCNLQSSPGANQACWNFRDIQHKNEESIFLSFNNNVNQLKSKDSTFFKGRTEKKTHTHTQHTQYKHTYSYLSPLLNIINNSLLSYQVTNVRTSVYYDLFSSLVFGQNVDENIIIDVCYDRCLLKMIYNFFILYILLLAI